MVTSYGFIVLNIRNNCSQIFNFMQNDGITKGESLGNVKLISGSDFIEKLLLGIKWWFLMSSDWYLLFSIWWNCSATHFYLIIVLVTLQSNGGNVRHWFKEMCFFVIITLQTNMSFDRSTVVNYWNKQNRFHRGGLLRQPMISYLFYSSPTDPCHWSQINSI